jgi:hypothetical protein
MAAEYTDEVWAVLSSSRIPAYIFIDIYLEGPRITWTAGTYTLDDVRWLNGRNYKVIVASTTDNPEGSSDWQDVTTTYFNDIHLTTWIRGVQDTQVDPIRGINVTYQPDLLGGLETPPKTGNVSQEIQRIVISQALGLYEDPAEFIIRLGNKFHNAKVRARILVEYFGELQWDSPAYTGDGLIKSVSRETNSQNVIVEVTNSFGKLETVKSLRTTSGSIKRFKIGDTSFDKASIDVTQRMLEWGVKESKDKK